jgi:hypothetical protein
MWDEEQVERREDWNDRHDVFQARGCGHEEALACAHPSGYDGSGVDLTDVVCSPGKLPPGARFAW